MGARGGLGPLVFGLPCVCCVRFHHARWCIHCRFPMCASAPTPAVRCDEGDVTRLAARRWRFFFSWPRGDAASNASRARGRGGAPWNPALGGRQSVAPRQLPLPLRQLCHGRALAGRRGCRQQCSSAPPRAPPRGGLANGHTLPSATHRPCQRLTPHPPPHLPPCPWISIVLSPPRLVLLSPHRPTPASHPLSPPPPTPNPPPPPSSPLQSSSVSSTTWKLTPRHAFTPATAKQTSDAATRPPSTPNPRPVGSESHQQK